MNETLNWQDLKDNKCPQCGGTLKLTHQNNPSYPSYFKERWNCERVIKNKPCGFKISEMRRQTVLENMRGGKGRDEVEENLSALSNL